MSIRDNAHQLKMHADQSGLKAQVNAISDQAAAITEVAATLLGDAHLGTTAITGSATAVVIKCEELTATLDLLAFTINNIADELINR